MVKITAKLITTKFRKLRGDNTDIKLWEEFLAEEQSRLLNGIELFQDETPVIAALQGPSPVIITTARILWRSQEVSHSLRLDQIASVNAPEVMHVSKLDLAELELTDIEKNRHRLRTKPGKPLFIVWNLLLRLVRSRKHKSRRP